MTSLLQRVDVHITAASFAGSRDHNRGGTPASPAATLVISLPTAEACFSDSWVTRLELSAYHPIATTEQTFRIGCFVPAADISVVVPLPTGSPATPMLPVTIVLHRSCCTKGQYHFWRLGVQSDCCGSHPYPPLHRTWNRPCEAPCTHRTMPLSLRAMKRRGPSPSKPNNEGQLVHDPEKWISGFRIR